MSCAFSASAFSALTLLVGRQEGHLAVKRVYVCVCVCLYFYIIFSMQGYF